MIDQGLTPGMQHQRQSQLNTKIVSTEFQQRLRGSPEEQVVHHSPVLPDDWIEPVWQGEDNVKIGNGQEQLLLSLQPFHRLVPLAIGTMPVAAGSGHEVLPSAMFAAVTVAAQLRRLAGQQRVEYFPVMRGKSRRLSRQCGTQHLCQAQPIPFCGPARAQAITQGVSAYSDGLVQIIESSGLPTVSKVFLLMCR